MTNLEKNEFTNYNFDDLLGMSMEEYPHIASRRGNIEIDDESNYTIFERLATIGSIIFAILTFPLAVFFCFSYAREYERAVVFRLGKLRKGVRGPGIFSILPCIDDIIIVDMRTESIRVSPQDVLTKDSVSIKLDVVIFFRVEDPIRGIVAVDNYRFSTVLLAQSMLRNVAGTKNLLDLLGHRKEVANAIHIILGRATEVWGIRVERVEMKDVQLPLDMQRSMAREAEAKRMAKAKIIQAEAEKVAADALKAASTILSTNHISLQLRYLQTLMEIGMIDNTTYILPFPKELGKRLFNIGSREVDA